MEQNKTVSSKQHELNTQNHPVVIKVITRTIGSAVHSLGMQAKEHDDAHGCSENEHASNSAAEV